MTSLVGQRMAADELAMTGFAHIILLTVDFLAIFLYLCTLTIRTTKGDFYLHIQK
jgi:hypothetical protein